MAKKIALTPTAVDTLTRGSLVDLLTPGLAVEVLGSGKKRWRYRRKIAGHDIVATLFGDLYPAQSISSAREWAKLLNDQVEKGIDPRAVQRARQGKGGYDGCQGPWPLHGGGQAGPFIQGQAAKQATDHQG